MSEHRIDGTYRYEENFAIRNFNETIDGEVMVVTGASYGMGKEMAQLMVEQRAKVFMTVRGKEELDAATADIEEKTGSDITGIITDSPRPEECRKVFEKAPEAYGDIDMLIDNADEGEFITIGAVSDGVIGQVVDINVKGPLYLCCEAVRYFLKKDNGNIISISSVNGIRPMHGAAYCATKSGLNTLTKNVAIRCIGTGVRCNAAVPGHTPNLTVYTHDDGGPQTLAEGVMNEVHNARTVRSVHPWEID